MKKITDSVAAAHRCSVPLVAIETPDPAATMRQIVDQVSNGTPKACWNVVDGFQKLNEQGDEIIRVTGGCPGNVLEALRKINAAPEESIVFIMMGDRWMTAPPVIQAIWNLRDEFKTNGRMLVLLCTDAGGMPPELKHDVVIFSEPLPDDEHLGQVLDDLCATAGVGGEKLDISDDVRERVIDAVRGLSAFEAEQVIAMSIKKDGVSVSDCQERKRKMVEQTKGLSVFTESHSFDDLAGLEQVKRYIAGLMNGPMRPKAVVWLDEIEKSGLAHTSDLSGVNSDSLGTVLSYMEDHKVFGVMLVGVPGCGKSELCKAMAAEFDTIVIRMDMGAMQGSLVGESQQNLRAALKTVDAICGENALFIATSNSIEGLDSALKSRFTDTFFFDLPSDEQRAQAWDVHKRKFGIEDDEMPNDEGWSGRNIQRCCQKAYSLGMRLVDAATFVIPEAIQSKEVVDMLRRQATGKYLSSDYPGAYSTECVGGTKGRRMAAK